MKLDASADGELRGTRRQPRLDFDHEGYCAHPSRLVDVYQKPVMFCSGQAAVNPAAFTEDETRLKPNWLLCSLNEPDMPGAALLTTYGKWLSKSS